MEGHATLPSTALRDPASPSRRRDFALCGTMNALCRWPCPAQPTGLARGLFVLSVAYRHLPGVATTMPWRRLAYAGCGRGNYAAAQAALSNFAHNVSMVAPTMPAHRHSGPSLPGPSIASRSNHATAQALVAVTMPLRRRCKGGGKTALALSIYSPAARAPPASRSAFACFAR